MRGPVNSTENTYIHQHNSQISTVLSVLSSHKAMTVCVLCLCILMYWERRNDSLVVLWCCLNCAPLYLPVHTGRCNSMSVWIWISKKNLSLANIRGSFFFFYRSLHSPSIERMCLPVGGTCIYILPCKLFSPWGSLLCQLEQNIWSFLHFGM